MILTGRLATSAQVSRFYTEAQAAARLDHPNIVPIHEIGEEDGCPFYTMRLIEGGSLGDRLKASRRPPEEVARLVAEVARAVHFAHQRGVLHRDLKPSNILLDAEGKPHVADFGLARLLDSASELSGTSVAVGTPAYMAPEQASGSANEVTAAADVYALGAVLYEALTGAPPFQAETPLKTLRLVTEAEPVLPRARDPAIPRDLEVICLKCLQKSPVKRYASAAELAQDLERWLAHEPILARPVSAGERLVSWAQRKPELAMAFAALFGVLAVALAITLTLLMKVRRESDARATALRLEESQRLALQSLAVVGENPGQALLLSLEAAARAPSLSANNAMFTALEANRERRRLLGHAKMVRLASFSPDGLRVATASHDMTARIWSVETGATSVTLRGHQGTVKTAEFSPDGTRVLTASDDATARIWDAASGVEILKLAGHEHPLRSASFSPDGTRVLTVGQQTARLWDARTGASTFVFDRHEGGVTCGNFSPDGRRIVTGGRDGTAKVWDAATGSLLATLSGHSAPVFDIAFSADGRVLATASAPEAHVWDGTTHEEISVARGHLYEIYAVALTSDGAKLATGSEDFTARVWDARSGRQIHVLPHLHKVVSVEISRDDALLLTASYDNSARVWDLASGKIVAEMKGHAAPLYHAAFSPDCRQAVTSSVDFTARLWTIRPSLPVALGSWGAACVSDADVTADGKLVVEAYWGLAIARVLELESHREITRLEGHTKNIQIVRFSLAGDRIASGSDDTTARLWDARNGKALHTLIGHEAAVSRLSFSPDGRHMMTLSHDHSARLWSVEEGVQVAVYQTKRQFRSATFAPDSDRIALADDGGWLRIGRISTGELTVFQVDDPIVCADFGSQDWELAVTLGTTRAQIRRLDDRSVVAELIHPARASYLMCSPDQRWLATLAEDATVRLWETATREEHVDIKRVGCLADWVHFPASGRHLVVKWVKRGTRAENTIFEVMIYPLDILGAARSAKFGDLTPDELDHFQLGSHEERHKHRERWTGGHIFGKGAGGEQ